jgi:hypothetical protein
MAQTHFLWNIRDSVLRFKLHTRIYSMGIQNKKIVQAKVITRGVLKNKEKCLHILHL